MGIIATSERVARNLWRLPGVGRALEYDYERFFAKRPANRFRGVYRTFAEAEASIPAGHPVGYDHDALGGMYRARIDKACESDYGPLFWLRGIVGGGTRVFDFGGHVGVAFHGWRRYLGYPVGLQWLVYEVPAIARAGRQLATERPSEGLSFTSDLADGKHCNLLLVAGSLQYADLDVPGLLDAMGNRPKHIVLNKMPAYDGETFVTVQSTGRAFHAYRIFNRDELVRSVTRLGYRLVDDWQNREQHCEIPFTKGRNIDAYSGYFFEKD